VTEQHAEKKVRSLAESALFYVGIPAAALYPLGVLGVGIQLLRDPLFPYSRLDTVWLAVSLVPEKVVIGTGIRLLFFALLSTAFGIGVSVLVVRGLILLGREPAEASAVGKGDRRVGWSTCSCLCRSPWWPHYVTSPARSLSAEVPRARGCPGLSRPNSRLLLPWPTPDFPPRESCP
jgi:hypothetical protein